MNYLEFWKKFSVKWLLQSLSLSAIIIICFIFGMGSQYILLILIAIVNGQQLNYSVKKDLEFKEDQKILNHLYVRITDLEKFILEKK